jgi:hypothetical protein
MAHFQVDQLAFFIAKIDESGRKVGKWSRLCPWIFQILFRGFAQK